MRIAHISDLHLCSKHKRNNIAKTKRLIQLAVDSGAQHLVITGDISDNAEEKDFNILREILKRYDLLKSDKTTILIGNHDIFGGPQTAQDVLSFPGKCMSVNYHEKVTAFVSHFKELFSNVIRPHEEALFPFAKELKDILLVGINSIDEYSRFKNPFASNGHVSKTQKKSLKEILSSNKFKEKVKIVLMHHHFYHKNIAAHSSESKLWNRIENFTMKLRGKKKLLKLFVENNVKIVLHGHSHEMKEYYRKGVRFINAGASVDNETNNEASLFLIDAFPFDISVEKVGLDIEQKSETQDEDVLMSLAG